MHWYNYVASFFSGMFLANTVPHFVKGVCGDRFPTPFAKPPGKGLSSPLVNVLWALLNLIIGFLLFRAGHVAVFKAEASDLPLILFFLGIAAISIMLSKNFEQKHSS